MRHCMDNELTESSEDTRIKEFPNDGKLWFIRWVDKYAFPHLDTQTPSVTVYMSQLTINNIGDKWPANTLRKDIVGESNQIVTVHVMTGIIPILRLGSIFRNGIQVGMLPSRNFELSMNLTQPLQKAKVSTSWPVRPPKYPENYNYCLINRFEYARHPEMANSECLVFWCENKQFIFPSHVIFRSFYAPCTELALAFTSNAWEFTKERAVISKETLVRPDQSWQVVLRTKIYDIYRSLVACLTLDPFGIACAKSIHSRLRAPPVGYLSVDIPFQVDSLEMKVSTISLDHRVKKYLVTDILSVSWPHSCRKIWYSRENDGSKGKEVKPSTKDKPYSGPRKKSPARDPVTPDTNCSDEDPSSNTPPTNYNTSVFSWVGESPEEKMQKQESHQYQGGNKIPSGEGPDDTASGNTTTGETEARRGEFTGQPNRATEKRIAQLLALLDSLKAKKEIDNWRPVPCPYSTEFADSIPYWYPPAYVFDELGRKKYPAWRYFDRTEKRLRRFLACEIAVRESKIFWLEIECRPSEGGFSSLLFTISSGLSEHCIQRLIYSATAHEGVWPQDSELQTIPGFAAGIRWRHVYPKMENGKRDYSRLHEGSALKAIQKLDRTEGS